METRSPALSDAEKRSISELAETLGVDISEEALRACIEALEKGANPEALAIAVSEAQRNIL